MAEGKRKVGRPPSGEKSQRRHFTISGLALEILQTHELAAMTDGKELNASKVICAAIVRANKDREFRDLVETLVVKPK